MAPHKWVWWPIIFKYKTVFNRGRSTGKRRGCQFALHPIREWIRLINRKTNIKFFPNSYFFGLTKLSKGAIFGTLRRHFHWYLFFSPKRKTFGIWFFHQGLISRSHLVKSEFLFVARFSYSIWYLEKFLSLYGKRIFHSKKVIFDWKDKSLLHSACVSGVISELSGFAYDRNSFSSSWWVRSSSNEFKWGQLRPTKFRVRTSDCDLAKSNSFNITVIWPHLTSFPLLWL